MGSFSSLYTGVSGLTAQGEALGVIGDNIANVNTNGFKASRAEFQDIIAKSIKGILGGNQIGRGTKIGAVTPIITQGNVDPTDKITDLAISGEGYFVLQGNDGSSFTRDGSFHFDREGYLVTNDNQRVMGYSADENGTIVNSLKSIRFPRALVPAQATKEVTMSLNLDSREQVKPNFDIENPFQTSNYSTGIEIFDSQGNRHLVTMVFNRVDDNNWEYRGLVDGKEVVDGEEGRMSQVIHGRLAFNDYGKLDEEEVYEMAFNFKGGAFQDQKITFDFGDAIKTENGTGLEGTKQYGKDSDLINWAQDGGTAGTITNLSFNDEGLLSAVYSNGQTKDLAQIALAKFENPEALIKVGNNRLKESRESGYSSVGLSGRNGRGKLFAKAIERSTVDLAKEFVNLIQNQRGFQANAKTITTADEMLNEVLALKR